MILAAGIIGLILGLVVGGLISLIKIMNIKRTAKKDFEMGKIIPVDKIDLSIIKKQHKKENLIEKWKRKLKKKQ